MVNDVEVRIGRHIWEEMTEEQQAAVKELSQRYAYDFGYDWQWEFFWLKFTPENWLMINMHDAELINKFRRT